MAPVEKPTQTPEFKVEKFKQRFDSFLSENFHKARFSAKMKTTYNFIGDIIVAKYQKIQNVCEFEESVDDPDALR